VAFVWLVNEHMPFKQYQAQEGSRSCSHTSPQTSTHSIVDKGRSDRMHVCALWPHACGWTVAACTCVHCGRMHVGGLWPHACGWTVAACMQVRWCQWEPHGAAAHRLHSHRSMLHRFV